MVTVLKDPTYFDTTNDVTFEQHLMLSAIDNQVQHSSYIKATPFVKWVGGKRKIIDQIAKYIPANFGEYYEAFVGGGALFYYLHDRVTRAILSDINSDLVITYNVIRNDVHNLIELLEMHQQNHNKEYYYHMRDSQRDLREPLAVAARLLYLNKTCYNGLYRVNKNGNFNVPMGRYKNPDIVSKQNLTHCANALQVAQIEVQQFDQIMPKAGDFVYFDPPYYPINGKNFTDYNNITFTEQDQIRLRDFAVKLHDNGVMVMLSNSSATLIRNLYSGKPFTVRSVYAPRFINCKPNERNNVEELLITTYE